MIALACVLACASFSSALTAESGPPKRAKPPEWTADVLDTFFKDARDALVGQRPAPAAGKASASSSVANNDRSTPSNIGGGKIPWRRLVEGETLVAEVKRLAADLREPLASPARFKSGGYQQARAEFNLLATIFAVIAEYDGDVRWKSDAAGMRDVLARTALSSLGGGDEAWADANQRNLELQDLVRGQPLGLGGEAAIVDWSAIADRPLLMERMERVMEERLTPALANARELAGRTGEVRQGAQLLAMLSEVIAGDGFDYWDDEPFRKEANELRAGALELNQAAAEENHEAARSALERIDNACTNCHATYRG